MKKFICVGLYLLVLAALFALCLFPAAATAENTATSGSYGTFSWRGEGDTLTISGTGTLCHPEGLANDWGGTYTTLIIENGITEIARGTFFRTYDLKTVYLPTSITHIGPFTFPNMSQQKPNWMDGYDLLRVRDVYYAGYQSQWDRIDLSPDSSLVYATIHCASSQVCAWYQYDGNWYYNQYGTDAKGWLVLGDITYYMDENGVMQTGWQTIDGKHYWFNQLGAMAKGWRSIGGKWYYFDNSGVMQTGWIRLSGRWYYLESDGVMVDRDRIVEGKLTRFASDGTWLGYGDPGFYTNTDGSLYYIRPGGSHATGWFQVSGKWYYAEKNGIVQTGFATIGGVRYYLQPTTGVMMTGWQKVDENWYYFTTDGAMKTGWLQNGGYWYYLQSDGTAATGKQLIGGKYYQFSDDNRMRTGWIDGSSANGTYQVRYYADASGAFQTGWRMVSGQWYYFYKDGHMARYTYIDHYYLDETGALAGYLDPAGTIDYHYGSTKAQEADAEARVLEIVQDTLANGGDTDYSKVLYAVKKLHKYYNTSQHTGQESGVYESIYAPLFLGISGNDSDQLAMGRILDYLGIEWYQGAGRKDPIGPRIDDGLLFIKMDGEYGWLNVWSWDLSYGSPEDENCYVPPVLEERNTAGTWTKSQGKWYFYNTQGQKVTGWLTTDNARYYLGTDGARSTGWVRVDGKWYYFNAEGIMLTGMQTIDGVAYCLAPDGKMWTGWFRSNRGDWFYADQGGVLAKGWKTLDGEKYYFYKDGHMACETFIGNQYINADGQWENSVSANPDHKYYKYLTTAQANQADAIAKQIAQEAMAKGGSTELEKVAYAAARVEAYVDRCRYQNDSNYYYRSPYGVFVAGVFTCAGSTRAMGRVLDYMGLTWYHVGEDQWDHQWVCLKMDGEYGWVEPQTGAAGYGNYMQSYNPY